MNNSTWKRISEQEGRIDPATIAHAKKVVILEERIEWWLGNLKGFPPGSNKYRDAEMLIRNYARQYKELTGDWYRRDAGE